MTCELFPPEGTPFDVYAFDNYTDETRNCINLDVQFDGGRISIDLTAVQTESLIDSLRKAINFSRYSQPEKPVETPMAAAAARQLGAAVAGDHHFVPFTTSAGAVPPSQPGVCSMDGCERTDAH